MQDSFTEYYEWRVRRWMIDPDVAAMLIGDYRQRATAVSGLAGQRRLDDVPRPQPLKLRTTARRDTNEERSA